MERKWLAVLVIGVTMLAGAARANGGHDGSGDGSGSGSGDNGGMNQCMADARAQKQSCKQVCRDDFLAAVDTCRGQNHDCAQAARDARDQCVADVIASLRTCLDTCPDLHAEIAQCRTDFPEGSPEREQCINDARVQGFTCRQQCRQTVDVFKNLKTCRDEFRTDLAACVPTPTPQARRR
jgi:hypothetical protein